jgi:hypothetical protein
VRYDCQRMFRDHISFVTNDRDWIMGRPPDRDGTRTGSRSGRLMTIALLRRWLASLYAQINELQAENTKLKAQRLHRAVAQVPPYTLGSLGARKRPRRGGGMPSSASCASWEGLQPCSRIHRSKISLVERTNAIGSQSRGRSGEPSGTAARRRRR